MSATLDAWVSSGALQRHGPSPQEIADLLALVERDLADSGTPGLSPDWRLAIAHNAAVLAARAALAAAGFRVSGREKDSYSRLAESLRHTVEAPAAEVDLLQRMNKKRHVSDCEAAGTVSESEAEEMYGLAERIRGRVREWLRTYHRQLLRTPG